MEDEEQRYDWGTLPLLPCLHIFQNLELRDICNAGRVCRHWHEASVSNSIWRPLCYSDWRIQQSEGNQRLKESRDSGFKDLYRDMQVNYGEFKECYARFADLWARYHAWLLVHSPQIEESLQPPCVVSQIKELESKHLQGLTLPLELKCAYLFHNGQPSTVKPRQALFGGYQYYEQGKFLSMVDIDRMGVLCQALSGQSHRLPDWLKYVCPVAFSSFGGHMILVLLKDLEGHGKSGEIVVASENYQDSFHVADSYYNWMLSHIQKLEAGEYSVSDGIISLFPTEGVKGVGVAVTKDIKIVASPLFIPERSNLTTNPHVYFWAYRIQMSMPNETFEVPSKLTTRHWVITDATGHVEEVRGPGVIGKYPVMKPGAYFEYESCCPLATPTGFMRGEFQMANKDTQEIFDAVVGEFQFVSPPAASQPGQQNDGRGNTTKKSRHS